MENQDNQKKQTTEESCVGGKVIQSIEAGPFKFVILEKLPFWTLETNAGPVVLNALTLPMLESMLVYPEIVSDASLYTAIATALNGKKQNSHMPYQEYALGGPYVKDPQFIQLPRMQMPPMQMIGYPPAVGQPPMPEWVKPTQDDINSKGTPVEKVTITNKAYERRLLLNKIIECCRFGPTNSVIDLGHCVITHQNTGCKWQLKAGVNIVMTCDDINYIIDYIIDNCNWQ